MIVIILLIGALVSPIYGLKRIVDSFLNKFKEGSDFLILHEAFIFMICVWGLWLTTTDVQVGTPIKVYPTGEEIENYAPIATEHLLTIAFFFALGIISYYLILYRSNKLSPIIYIVSSCIVILNIIFTGFFLTQIMGYGLINSSVVMGYGFVNLSIIYIAALRKSLGDFIEGENKAGRQYKNRLINYMYSFSIKYQSMAFLWGISLFPVLVVIQLVLVLFGQQPDSFIRAFLDTSNFHYSTITPPPPIVVESYGHYLCTVSLKGHKKIVKPVRAGIRYGNRILVNRQLLIANAFENILEEYTPRFHRIIRYIYDKYGFPLSNYIKNSWSADLVYVLMKPLEWIFLVVLYTVDHNPENRINVQYSELRD